MPAAKRKAPAKRKTPAKRKAKATGVVAAVRRDLAAIGKRDRTLKDSTEAATALELARQLDNRENSATSKSLCARALAEVMASLREQLPEEHKETPLDDLTRRREARLSRQGRASAKS